MSDPLQVLIGSAESGHVLITVLGHEHPHAEDYWDGNWLVTPIEIRAGQFSGSLPADLRSDEMRFFRKGLEALYGRLKGEAVLASLDGWITLTISCVTGGRLTIEGVVNDRPGGGNELAFHLDGLDQSYLPSIIESLLEVENAFPVRSRPDS